MAETMKIDFREIAADRESDKRERKAGNHHGRIFYRSSTTTVLSSRRDRRRRMGHLLLVVQKVSWQHAEGVLYRTANTRFQKTQQLAVLIPAPPQKQLDLRFPI
jgi:hypothetical protein